VNSQRPEETTLLGMRGAAIAGKVGYAASCLVAAVLVVLSGYAHRVDGLVTGLASSNAISGGAQTGAMNILLMGLESRTDYQGNTLSSALLTAMHAGSVYGVNNEGVGGQDTNTLILIHIFAGGQRAVGFSIPRDDWVTFPQAYDGQSAGKIDQAYGLAYAQSLNQTVSSSMSKSQRYFLANEAGQKATIDTVEAVTDQKIDHFAEVNLAGFFYLAQSFGGVEVCVNSWDGANGPGTNLHDANSGFNAVADGYNLKKGGSQYLHLAADQALAFVRERDNLPNGDLDRTHRQQAILDYVIWKLKTGGVLTDVGQLTGLLSTADKYLITDSSWNLLDFSTQMHALSGENLKFYTAPIVGYETVDGQDANQIDIPTIQAAIKAKFTAPAPSSGGKSGSASKPAKKSAPIPAASTVTVDVYNGGSTGGLAGRVSAALVAKGYRAGVVGDASAQPKTVEAGNEVFYGAGASANAAKIAGYFGVTATALGSLPAGHVEVLLGSGSTIVPSGLAPAASPTATPSAGSTSGNNGAAGSAVTVTANAKFGIPCVY
jgi:LCP family protein required for cell wall assembly